MPIFDTFETENYITYSGSYVSDYFAYLNSTVNSNGFKPEGSFFSKEPGTNANGRGKIFDISSKQKTNYYPEVKFDGETWLKFNTNQTNILGRPQKFIDVFSENEFYFDSVMPYPYDIHLANGAQSVFSPVTYYLLNGKFGHTLYLSPYTQLTASNNFVNISDNKWIYSFPFSSKYKNLKRLIDKNSVDETMEYYASGVYGISQSSAGVEWQIWKYGTGTAANFLMPQPVKTNTSQFAIAWLVPSQSFPNGKLTNPDSLFSSDRKLNNTFLIPWNTKLKKDITTDIIENISLESQYNSYFGFGNSSPQKLPSYLYQQNYSTYVNFFAPGTVPITTGSNGQSILKINIGIMLRGYKYGIYSPNLAKTKNVFRIGKYGQFRDMLEQRPFTQFINKGTVVSNKVFPIDITFITGSTIYTQAKDYVSATNPSYNPYDSGIYDYHYRSGQPFTDR